MSQWPDAWSPIANHMKINVQTFHFWRRMCVLVRGGWECHSGFTFKRIRYVHGIVLTSSYRAYRSGRGDRIDQSPGLSCRRSGVRILVEWNQWLRKCIFVVTSSGTWHQSCIVWWFICVLSWLLSSPFEVTFLLNGWRRRYFMYKQTKLAWLWRFQQ